MNTDPKKIQTILEDGRKAEKVVTEVQEEGKKITELWVEPTIEKRLSKRVVEYTKPVVHRREIETVDEETGDIKERHIESLDPEVKMELREIIKSNQSVSAMSVEEPPCYVTEQLLQRTVHDGVLAIVKALKEPSSSDNYGNDDTVSAMQVMVGDKVETETQDKTEQMVGWGLWTLIAALGSALLYVLM
jgi:hypothetical protein